MFPGKVSSHPELPFVQQCQNIPLSRSLRLHYTCRTGQKELCPSQWGKHHHLLRDRFWSPEEISERSSLFPEKGVGVFNFFLMCAEAVGVVTWLVMLGKKELVWNGVVSESRGFWGLFMVSKLYSLGVFCPFFRCRSGFSTVHDVRQSFKGSSWFFWFRNSKSWARVWVS